MSESRPVDPVPAPIRAAFDLLYQAARRAPLPADEHDAIRHAVGMLNEALAAAYPPPQAPEAPTGPQLVP